MPLDQFLVAPLTDGLQTDVEPWLLPEQAYARLKNDIGVACVTTGPGGTNAITGVAASWVDCIPIMIISGLKFMT